MAASLDALDYDLRAAALSLDQAVHASGLQGRFTSTLRTHAEQTRLYRRWLQGMSPLPAAPPGQSAHEYGLAFDYLVTPKEYTRDVASFAIAELGLAWSEKDFVQYEIPGASAWAAAQPTDANPSLRAQAANIGVGLLPGPAGVVATVGGAVQGTPLIVDVPPLWKWTWQDLLDPQGFFHILSWLK